jgi:(p)ppGpp synthase/HD superfamily hydrolase
MNIVDYADLYATRAHQDQYRKYTHRPYIEHPRRVAEHLRLLNASYDVNVPGQLYYLPGDIAAAYLHDVLEDCDVSYAALAVDFGHYVAYLVQSLTNTSKQTHPEANRAERKRIDRERLRQANRVVKSIKLADRLDNLWDFDKADDPGFWQLYVRESYDLLQVLEGGDVRLYKELEGFIIEALKID